MQGCGLALVKGVTCTRQGVGDQVFAVKAEAADSHTEQVLQQPPYPESIRLLPDKVEVHIPEAWPIVTALQITDKESRTPCTRGSQVLKESDNTPAWCEQLAIAIIMSVWMGLNNTVISIMASYIQVLKLEFNEKFKISS